MSPLRTLLFALFLIGIGFFVGYGYQSQNSPSATTIATTPQATPQAPTVKGLHASPDGKLLAFTGVYAHGEQAGVWILNPATGVAHGRPTPDGWQDFVTQWNSNGRSLLLEREKIPRPVADAKAGLFTAPINRGTTEVGELQPLASSATPSDEKIITGFLAPDGELVLKTKREPKSLYLIKNGAAIPVDHASINYGQNRPVREDGKLVFYVVRDVPAHPDEVALFRVQDGHARQMSPAWDDVSWSYVAPSGKSLIVARQNEDDDWDWTLYRIIPTGIQQLKNATIPADVISVYWSPDEKHVLGAAGEKLWMVDVPTLKVKQLGTQNDWNADDASWMGNDAVAIAKAGELWRLSVPSGGAIRLWRFPNEFWQ